MPRGSPDQFSDPETASSSTPLLELPPELLVLILEYLPLRDLTKMCLVCSQLNGIVNSEHFTSLWTKASLEQLWPSQNNTHVIHKAGKRGNTEALIKLSVAYLYSEGVPEGDGKGTIASSNGVAASRLLSQAERRIANQEPFSWVLIRPPWTSTGLCCKACVCEHMKLHHDEEKPSSAIPYCIGKVLSFLEPPQNHDAVIWFRKAADLGCPYATYELWQLDAGEKRWTAVEEIQLVRRLRALASTNIWPARLDLCLAYINHQYGGINKEQATQFVKHVFDQAKPVYTNKLFTIQKKLNYSMRYILVDWLIEVSEMKEFSSLVLHVAVDCVDRYLQLRPISRNWLQLVGITGLLLAARWNGSTIITVREAAWLTENTYRYEDVVRTVGEMLSVFNGYIRLPCTTDYLDMLLRICRADDRLRHTCQYISECALLYTELRIISPSVLAAAILLLSNVLTYQEAVWTQSMTNFTGLHMDQLAPYCVNIYSHCFAGEHPVTDHRNNVLRAVQNRFSSDRYSGVSKMDTLSLDLIRQHLGYQSLRPSSSLSTSQESQESMILSDWTESEDMEASQLLKDRSSLSSNSEDEQVTISLEEASQRIACKETYRAPPDQEIMDMGIHLQKSATIKQKRAHNGDSPRQPLKQINNTIQEQGKSPGPSKVSSLSSCEKRTRKSKV